jgi:hypothetical protein
VESSDADAASVAVDRSDTVEYDRRESLGVESFHAARVSS